VLQTGEMLVVQSEEGTWVPQLPEKIWWGSIFIGIAAIVDFLDGFVARLLMQHLRWANNWIPSLML